MNSRSAARAMLFSWHTATNSRSEVRSSLRRRFSMVGLAGAGRRPVTSGIVHHARASGRHGLPRPPPVAFPERGLARARPLDTLFLDVAVAADLSGSAASASAARDCRRPASANSSARGEVIERPAAAPCGARRSCRTRPAKFPQPFIGYERAKHGLQSRAQASLAQPAARIALAAGRRQVIAQAAVPGPARLLWNRPRAAGPEPPTRRAAGPPWHSSL